MYNSLEKGGFSEQPFHIWFNNNTWNISFIQGHYFYLQNFPSKCSNKQFLSTSFIYDLHHVFTCLDPHSQESSYHCLLMANTHEDHKYMLKGLSQHRPTMAKLMVESNYQYMYFDLPHDPYNKSIANGSMIIHTPVVNIPLFWFCVEFKKAN